jgi:acetylornithine deacetylase/succinyl-diaminopimelate desuccinylase-like protein
MADLNKIYEYVDRKLDEYVEEVRRYLRQPGISHSGEGIKESAEMTLGYIKDLRPQEAKLVPLKHGHPVVYGKLRSRNSQAKTLIFYEKYDMTAVLEGWSYPPFAATVVNGEEIGLPPSMGKVIISQGSHDKRAPDLAFILAQKVMLEVTGDVPVNIIFCIEGTEQNGSLGFDEFLGQYADELKIADAVWSPGTYRQDHSGRLNIHRGYKGNIFLELEVKGGNWGGRTDGRDLTSVHFALVNSPLSRLIQALNTLFDQDDRILVEGFYDDVRPPTSEEEDDLRKLLETVDEEKLKRELCVKKFKKGSFEDLFKNFILGPLITIDGIISGYTGSGISTTLPMKAIAKIDVRLVPNMEIDSTVSKIQRHLANRGFKEVEVRKLAGNPWCRSPRKAGICQALTRAAELMGVEYIVWPTTPAAMGVGHFNRPPFNLPVAFGMMGQGGGFHCPNEYVTVKGIADSIKYAVTFLYEFAKI